MGSRGVHSGITLYSYPQEWTHDAKHPQMASLDELQNVFQSGFFATADFVFDPEANGTGYNGANVMADVTSEAGKLALGHKMAAHVALLKVVKDRETGKSKISEVIMLGGQPRSSLVQEISGQSAMNALRMQRMQQSSIGRGVQIQEPCPEPSLQMPSRQMQSQEMPLQQMVMPQRGLQQIP